MYIVVFHFKRTASYLVDGIINGDTFTRLLSLKVNKTFGTQMNLHDWFIKNLWVPLTHLE